MVDIRYQIMILLWETYGPIWSLGFGFISGFLSLNLRTKNMNRCPLNREKCCRCGEMAVWCYMPGDDNGKDHFCDKHVPRGCSCNQYQVAVDIGGNDITKNPQGIEGKDWKWVTPGEVFEELKDGKRQPCCEFWYNKDGWDRE